MKSVRGQLLVATPAITGEPFERSVVFVLDHDADGALGVIVNRPMPTPVADVLPTWGGFVNEPSCLFEGGPVSVNTAIAVGIARAGAEPLSAWRSMCGQVGLVDLDASPPTDEALAGLRVFAGYAGWSAGQLEGELDEGSWLVVDAEDADLLTIDPAGLWRAVLRRQRDDRQLWATFPEDPTFN